MKIHLWAPGLGEQCGGIEAYSAALVSALKEIVGSENVEAFAKNDRSAGTGAVPSALRTPVFAGWIAARAIIGKPDLIVTTHLNFSPVAAWLQRRCKIPYWVCLHGIEAWNLDQPDRRRAVGSADLLLPVSSFTRDHVAREQGIAKDRFRILPNTFDAAQFSIGPKPRYLLERYRLSPEQPTVLTVGRLSAVERYKGHDRVIRALPLVQRSIPKLRYVIVGDGDDRPRLAELAKAESVSESVIFAGRVSGNELNDHYNLCDLFAMPSTGEGFGIVFLEALACGKPVLGGSKDATTDALHDGELGVLVDADDPDELNNTITTILQRKYQHPLLYQPEQLREKVIEYFSYEKFKATLSTYLEEFFKGPKLGSTK